ncbi:MAG: substrate-binding domain-containing protein [Kiritimatiellae bacterium]|nr:substrate-binding domain-containing protein [Kiritimatiellia bacterium]
MRNKTAYKKPPFELDRTRHGDLARQIADGLRTAIETGYYRPGDVLPPVRDLGEILGVSMGIAVQAVTMIREESLISPRPRVGSVVCSKDRPLWKGHVVIVVPPGRGNPFDNMVHVAVRDGLIAAGYLPLSASVGETAPGKFNDFSLLDTILKQQTDLVVQIQGQECVARWLSRRGVPFVRFGLTDFKPPNCVGLVRRNDDAAVADFAAHCREAGVKSVAQISVFNRANVAAALSAAGIEVRTWRVPRALDYGTGYELSQWAMSFFRARLASRGAKGLPELIFSSDDHLTTGMLAAFYEAGVRIPGDVRLATLANIGYGPVFPLPLTRMEFDTSEIGKAMTGSILSYLQTGEFPQGIVVGPKYVRGETF